MPKIISNALKFERFEFQSSTNLSIFSIKNFEFQCPEIKKKCKLETSKYF